MLSPGDPLNITHALTTVVGDITVCYAQLINASAQPSTNATRSQMNPYVPDCAPYKPFDPCRARCYPRHEPLQFDAIMQQPSSLITYGRVYPFLAALTIVSNCFIVAVLSRPAMRRSTTNRLLLYMAIADLGVALIPFPFVAFYILGGAYRHPRRIRTWWCYLAMYTSDSLPPFCHNVAIWLAVLLAGQRYFYLQFPLKAPLYFTPRRVNVACGAVVALSLVCAAPKFICITTFSTLKWQVRNVARRSEVLLESYRCIFRYSAAVERVGQDVYFMTYYWTRVVAFVVVPSVLLVAFTALLIGGIRATNRRRARLVSSASTTESNSTSTMLVLIVSIFLIINLPQGLLLAVFCVSQVVPGGHAWLDKAKILIATNCDNMLVLATYPVNLAIYCCMSSQFRATFAALFCPAPLRRAAERRRRQRRRQRTNKYNNGPDGAAADRPSAAPLVSTRQLSLTTYAHTERPSLFGGTTSLPIGACNGAAATTLCTDVAVEPVAT